MIKLHNANYFIVNQYLIYNRCRYAVSSHLWNSHHLCANNREINFVHSVPYKIVHFLLQITMCACSVSAKKTWVFGCGTSILLLSLIVGLLWPTLSMQVLYSVRIYFALYISSSDITPPLHTAISLKKWFAQLQQLD